MSGPTSSDTRRRLLLDLARRVLDCAGPDGLRVGVDGVDGSGKTTFAGELATAVRSLGRDVVQISADNFHQQRALRHRRGRNSAEGFWLDSYDYPTLRADVLDGFGRSGTGRYREASHHLASDRLLDLPWRTAAPGAILILDGLFLHRAELAEEWDFSIFLEVPFAVSVGRMAERDGSDPDPEHPDNARYVGGQRLYFAACSPWDRTSLVVDNSNLAEPKIIHKPSLRSHL
jgi:uridine kinase